MILENQRALAGSKWPWWKPYDWVTNDKHWKDACREVAKLLGESDPYPISITALPVRDYNTDPFDIKNGGCFTDSWTLEIKGVPCRILHSAGSWKGETYHYYKHKMHSKNEVIEWLKTVAVPSELSNKPINTLLELTTVSSDHSDLKAAVASLPKPKRSRPPLQVLYGY